jgi:hypothetical protein
MAACVAVYCAKESMRGLEETEGDIKVVCMGQHRLVLDAV